MGLRNKTKIVATIGPASDSPRAMRSLIMAGMNVARLNFSHGDFDTHARVIRDLRDAAKETGRRLAIMADLPGPKIRIGEIESGPIELAVGDSLRLTTDDVKGTHERISVNFEPLPRIIRTGDKLFLNDGLVSLKVLEVEDHDVLCEVRSGGKLSSRKGLNLPGIDLGISAFTARDRECLAFALEHGVDAVSQSFVSGPEDVSAVRDAAASMGHQPLIIAKIERARAVERLDDILGVADGLMVARGDLGVETPIAEMAVVQKDIMRAANAAGKPVITATQMLESMTAHRRPTRAEATDVANAILDGTDAVMLSAESATGAYPTEAVGMLAEIAEATENHRGRSLLDRRMAPNPALPEMIARSIHQAVESLEPAAVIVPTRSGTMARNVARYRLRSWITAFSVHHETCQGLQFSYGIHPVHVDTEQADWTPHVRDWLRTAGVTDGVAVLAQGPSESFPCGNHRMELVDLTL